MCGCELSGHSLHDARWSSHSSLFVLFGGFIGQGTNSLSFLHTVPSDGDNEKCTEITLRSEIESSWIHPKPDKFKISPFNFKRAIENKLLLLHYPAFQNSIDRVVFGRSVWSIVEDRQACSNYRVRGMAVRCLWTIESIGWSRYGLD